MKPYVLICVSLVLAACSSEAPPPDTPRPALVAQPVAADGALESYSGEVRARYEPQLGFRIAGKISRRLVNVGDRVKQGQPLAELNAEDVGLQMQAARARMSAAKADQELAESELQRYRKLMEREVISRSQFDSVESRFKASDAQYNQARADFNVARNQTDYAVLRAPQDGVIASRQAEAGQVVAAGQAVFTLAVAGEREVRIDLPERDVDKVTVGQKVRIELWSRQGKPFPGTVRELSPAADPVSRTFEARVAFDNDAVGAELGQSARVYSRGSDAQHALLIPLSALSADHGEAFVWVVSANGSLRKTPVQVGAYREDQVPVLAGLKPDQWVIAAGTQVLHEGQKVRPVDRANRSVDLATGE
ncbi:efflux transporter periplasmic adaptor subunit [Alcanivorax sp. N3-2A]|nr:efflux transporter periplasmic adaptor subunit [Alcanivorax sp. N3-2A]